MLAEGDDELYAQAASAISACEERSRPPRRGASPARRRPHAGSPGRQAGAQAGRRGIRLFMEAFTARDILEPLSSYDAATVRRLPPGEWPWPDLPIAGVRERGDDRVPDPRGPGGAAGRSCRGIDPQQLVAPGRPADGRDPRPDPLRVVASSSWAAPWSASIGRADIGKPVVRMWLFGDHHPGRGARRRPDPRRWPEGAWAALRQRRPPGEGPPAAGGARAARAPRRPARLPAVLGQIADGDPGPGVHGDARGSAPRARRRR